MRQLLTNFFLATCVVLAACAGMPTPGIRVIGAGTLTAEKMTPIPALDALAGKMIVIAGVRLERETKVVLGIQGTLFGFIYQVEGMPPGSIVTLRARTIYPRGLTNPATGRRAAYDEFEVQCSVGATCTRGRYFSQTWELVPGVWALELWAGDTLLVRREFDVVP